MHAARCDNQPDIYIHGRSLAEPAVCAHRPPEICKCPLLGGRAVLGGKKGLCGAVLYRPRVCSLQVVLHVFCQLLLRESVLDILNCLCYLKRNYGIVFNEF